MSVRLSIDKSRYIADHSSEHSFFIKTLEKQVTAVHSRLLGLIINNKIDSCV